MDGALAVACTHVNIGIILISLKGSIYFLIRWQAFLKGFLSVKRRNSFISVSNQ